MSFLDKLFNYPQKNGAEVIDVEMTSAPFGNAMNLIYNQTLIVYK